MSDPFYPAKSGDPILADTWNNMQIKVRDEIRSHTHRGADDGKQLDGDSIVPTASLKVNRVDASVALTVKSIDVLTRLTELGAQKLSLTGGAMTGALSVNSSVAVGASAPGTKRLLVVQPGTPDNNAGLEVRGNGDHSWGVNLVLRTVAGVDGASMLLRSRSKSWQVRGETGAAATGFQITEDGGDVEYGSGAGTPRLHIKSGGAVGIGTTDPQGMLDVRVPGANGWDRLTVTTTADWGDGTLQYVTIGAGGASGIMMSNPHVVWHKGAQSAAIRYGRSGGVQAGAFWDVGTRPNNAFSLALNGGNHALWLTQEGNIGIGTTAPAVRLDVQGGGLRVNGGAIIPSVGNSPSAGIMFPTDPGGGSGDAAFIRYYVVGGEACKLLIGIDNDGDDSLGFWQTGGERMTVMNGNVGIGVTNPLTALHINQRAWSQGIRIQDYTGGGRYFGIHYDNPGVICLYHQNGSGQYMKEDGLWNRNSDVSLKENIVEMQGVLERFVALRPVTFDWKVDGLPTLGLVAQEVEPLFPDIVSESGKRGEDGRPLKGLAYEALGVLAVAAIKELKQHYDARIEALERQLQRQESNR
ncbi:tail fiber domain-containing protein [Corallococcus sp. Z5C101001]|uniref:tail fiber domain-containing protein n=1 Tax=Corallococcus sp. Z5C101001 TaxID=2596829 RepID=UPI00117D9E84|nr:tail fiber domain-containing protein [Corallococcus sp. Z5C101001]TSC34254.1 tail fiber domain-containing protein [Corallococcus sp. Z5C101001]